VDAFVSGVFISGVFISGVFIGGRIYWWTHLLVAYLLVDVPECGFRDGCGSVGKLGFRL